MALNEHDVDVLISMVGGRVNAVKANKQLDSGERQRIVNEYETVHHHLLVHQRENHWGRFAEDVERLSEAAMREVEAAEQ